jgi:hypothetical protein
MEERGASERLERAIHSLRTTGQNLEHGREQGRAMTEHRSARLAVPFKTLGSRAMDSGWRSPRRMKATSTLDDWTDTVEGEKNDATERRHLRFRGVSGLGLTHLVARACAVAACLAARWPGCELQVLQERRFFLSSHSQAHSSLSNAHMRTIIILYISYIVHTVN